MKLIAQKEQMFIVEGERCFLTNESLLEGLEKGFTKSTESCLLSEIQLDSPMKYPRRGVIAVGKNYLDHVREVDGQTGGPKGVPEKPIYFTKRAYPTVGPNEKVPYYETLDYEVELAVIIGKTSKNLTLANAKDAIFGYTIANDLSIRTEQKKRSQWDLAKGFDGSCPLGPWIITKDEFSHPLSLEIQSYVNGELRQHSNTKHMIHSIDELLVDLTKYITLYPGDIILTGTPSGVGMGFEPPRFLKPGDTITCTIEGIGSLENEVSNG
ncbi:fumarylacetoacetate hydrolase family protein [Guggenheimella bovis]